MKINNEVKVTFPSRSINEGFARMTVAAFTSRLDPSASDLSDVKTAVSEAVTNCIVHGYKDAVGKIELVMRILDENILYIRVKDNGCGICDIKQAREPMFTTALYDERAGLGFSVMECFMDKLVVKSKLGTGTTVIMQKKIFDKSVATEKNTASQNCEANENE